MNYIAPKTIYDAHITDEAREAHCKEVLNGLLQKANIEMDIDEFIKVYSSNRGIKNKAMNVWRNIYKWQLYLEGNYKYLYDILGDSLNFMKPNPKEFNQKEYIKQFNKDNYKHYHIQVNLKDKEVIDKLNSVDSKNGYIIDLIKKDIKND